MRKAKPDESRGREFSSLDGGLGNVTLDNPDDSRLRLQWAARFIANMDRVGLESPGYIYLYICISAFPEKYCRQQ